MRGASVRVARTRVLTRELWTDARVDVYRVNDRHFIAEITIAGRVAYVSLREMLRDEQRKSVTP